MMGTIALVMIVLGLIWFVLGIFTCRKHLWAAYAITGMSGLSLIGNLMSVNVPGMVGAGAILAESIVIGQKGRELKSRGIRLDQKP